MKNKISYYNVGIVEVDGEFKIMGAEKLQPINQFKSEYKKVNARNLARNINRGNLVIK